MIKKFLYIAFASLVALACSREEKDLFDSNAASRLDEAVKTAQQVITGAANGWRMEYFPENTQCYGGYLLMAKFGSDNSVEMASELKASDYREKSLFSFTKENGPVLCFDTYNSCIHFFADAGEGAHNGLGTLNGGLLGDYEFIVMSATPQKVVLKGNKTNNKIVMTPASDDWTAELDAFKELVENNFFPGYSSDYVYKDYGKINVSKPSTYQGFTSRRFDITHTRITEVEKTNSLGEVYVDKEETEVTVTMGFIYTEDGIRFHQPYEMVFYEPLVKNKDLRDVVTVSELKLKDGYMYFDESTGFEISGPTPVVSENQISLVAGESTFSTASISVTTTNDDLYYLDYMSKAEYESYKSADDLKRNILIALNEMISPYKSAEQVLAQYTVSGDQTISFKDMKMNSDFVAIAVGLAESRGCIVTSTDFFVQPFGTTDLPSTATAAYKKWIGTWRITSASSEETKTQKVFTVHVWPRVLNSRYFMSGFGIQAVKDLDGYEVETRLSSNNFVTYHFNCTDKSITNTSSTSVQFRLRFLTLSTNAISNYGSSSNPGVTFKFDDTSAQTATGTGRESSTIRILSQVYWDVRGGSAYYYSAIAPEVKYNTTSYKDFPIGPYTMEKLSDDINYVGMSTQAKSSDSSSKPTALPHTLQVQKNKSVEQEVAPCYENFYEDLFQD